MKTCTTEREYINLITLSVQKACKRYGYLPSVLIAQSCLENGYGIPSYWDNPEIKKLLDVNNMVGIKSSLLNNSWSDYTVWKGDSILKKTPEEYGGKMVTITDYFRQYDSIERSFCDFLLFLTYASNNGKGGTPKYGKNVLSIKDPETLIKKVSSLGYATGSSYPTSVMRIINKHNLTQYDNLNNIQPTDIVPDIIKQEKSNMNQSNIIKLTNRTIIDITDRNRSEVPRSRGGNSITYIVVHYLGVPNADNPDLYGGGYGGHYNIKRNGSIYKAANPRTAVVWHCGGGLQGSGGHSFYGKCTNYNSIGIECGVSANTTAKDLSGDSGLWYFTEETQESLVWLVSKLMDEYGISFDHVIRHYDVTGKICPNPYVKNNKYKTSWTWDQFKANLKQYRKDGTITLYSGTTVSSITSSTKSYLSKGDSGDEVKTMQTMLTACGYDCKGIDGSFGNNTLAALKKFQTDNKLTVDGLYGSASKSALEKLYKSITTQTDAQKTFINSIDNVAKMAREKGWTYGNSQSKKPCQDKKISCDRLVARALYDLGYTDQPKGGITCGHVESYLPKFGFTKVTKKQQIKPGAVIAVRQTNHSYIDHIFVVKSYNAKTDTCDKYDTGSDSSIKSVQPFKNRKLVEWSNRIFVAAWNVPNNLKSNEKETNNTTTTVSTIWNGVDYKYVYNYEYYKNKYEDLRKAFGTNEKKYFEHFYTYGMKEGRQASANFNVQAYKKRYSDLQKAFGNNLPEYYKHYCIYGRKENRKTT